MYEENNNTKGNAKQIRENAKNTYGKEVSNYIVKVPNTMNFL